MHKEPDVGLARMVEFYERKHLLKDSVRLSDWERKELTEEQIECSSSRFPRDTVCLTPQTLRCRKRCPLCYTDVQENPGSW